MPSANTCHALRLSFLEMTLRLSTMSISGSAGPSCGVHTRPRLMLGPKPILSGDSLFGKRARISRSPLMRRPGAEAMPRADRSADHTFAPPLTLTAFQATPTSGCAPLSHASSPGMPCSVRPLSAGVSTSASGTK
jgi:hypothetical protein